MVSSARNVRYWEGNERITLGSWQLKEKRLLVITIARRLNQNALTITDEVRKVGGDYFADPAQKNDDCTLKTQEQKSTPFNWLPRPFEGFCRPCWWSDNNLVLLLVTRCSPLLLTKLPLVGQQLLYRCLFLLGRCGRDPDAWIKHTYENITVLCLQ